MSGWDYEKDPDATLDYTIDWSAWLTTINDTIITSTWDMADGPTWVDETFTDTTTTIWLSGGTDGTLYAISNTIATEGGRTNSRDFIVWVHTIIGRERQPLSRQTPALVTPAQVRTRIRFEQNTPDSTINEYIKAVHSRIVAALGYDYPRDPQEVFVDTTSDSVLILPGSGARRILSVIENGTPLTDDLYELDPEYPTVVRRLESSTNTLRNWYYGNRKVTVRYLPARPPEALVDQELIEVVRAYRAAQSGYADRAGPDGASIPFRGGLGSDTKALIEQLKHSNWVGIW